MRYSDTDLQNWNIVQPKNRENELQYPSAYRRQFTKILDKFLLDPHTSVCVLIFNRRKWIRTHPGMLMIRSLYVSLVCISVAALTNREKGINTRALHVYGRCHSYLAELGRKFGPVAVDVVSITRPAVLRYLQSAVAFVRFPPAIEDIFKKS